jgi:hypothetical protein
MSGGKNKTTVVAAQRFAHTLKLGCSMECEARGQKGRHEIVSSHLLQTHVEECREA